jgi:hypothetical protein
VIQIEAVCLPGYSTKIPMIKTLPFGVFLRSWPKPNKYMTTDLIALLLGSIAEYELRNKKARPKLDKEVF